MFGSEILQQLFFNFLIFLTIIPIRNKYYQNVGLNIETNIYISLRSCCLHWQTSNLSLKTRGAAAPPHSNYLASLLGLEEPSLKLLRSAELQCTNSSPISNCQHSKSAIFILRNINSNINSLLRLRVGTHIIYIYIYLLDERYIPEVEMKTI